MTLEEILSKQAKGEKLSEDEEKFLKTSNNEPESKKDEGKKEEESKTESNPLEELNKLKAELDKLKTEKE